MTAARPPHRQPRLLLAVLAGGLLGTAARYGVALALPTRSGGWPAGTFLVNLVGAFLLGLLLEALLTDASETPGRRLLRCAAGTGLLGAFTTYSALAVETDQLVRASRPLLAAAYALGSVVGGLLCSTAGIAVAARRRA